jgi:hypothetical protein
MRSSAVDAAPCESADVARTSPPLTAPSIGAAIIGEAENEFDGYRIDAYGSIFGIIGDGIIIGGIIIGGNGENGIIGMNGVGMNGVGMNGVANGCANGVANGLVIEGNGFTFGVPGIVPTG